MTGWQILRVACAGPRPSPLPDFDRPTVLVFPADAVGEALAGAIAVRESAVVLGRVTLLHIDAEGLVARRSGFGGRVETKLRVSAGLAVATSHDDTLGSEDIVLGAPDDLVIERSPHAGHGVSLEAASIVLGGGRGLDPAGFAYLDRIASRVGGAVAASLAAVDLGLAAVAQQVGQSGKFVNPAIYLAAGMSGTPQHFAGVGARARIVAINNDPSAAIFRFADVGTVGDAGEILPLVDQALSGLASG